MFTPTGNWDGQITECELLKMIDTCVFRLNKQLYSQFHYSYSIDSHVNIASKRHKVLTLDKCIKAIKLLESSLVWVVCKIKKDWNMANSVDPDQMPHSAASNLGLHCLQRPICPDTKCYYGIYLACFWIFLEQTVIFILYIIVILDNFGIDNR